MSQFEEITDANRSVCPYCSHSYKVESEDYSEDMEEVDCENCGMKYYLKQDISVTHTTKPDCALNEKEHEYELIVFGGEKIRSCKICGYLNFYRG